MRTKAVLLSLLFANAVASQDSSFTAKEAIDLALKQNLDIQISSTDLDIAKANNNWGNAGGLPTATGNIFNTEAISNINQKLANGSNIERNNVSNSSINANLAISWRVFNGMRVRSTMERFDAMEKMGTIAVAQQIDQVIFDVLNIYYNLIRLKKQVIATKAIIDLSKERLKIAETRFNVGSGAKTDMLQAKIDLNAQEVNLQNIYKQVSNTKASMNTLLKKDAGASFHPKEEQFSIPSIEYNTLVSKIDQQNPQLLLAQQEKLNLMIEKKIISSQRMPSVNLNSNTVLNRSKSTAGFFLTNQTFGPNIGLGIGIPIFNGNINKTQLKVNSIQQKKQDLQTEQLRALLQRDLLIAFQEYQNAVSVSMVEESNVQLAKENNFISTERFKKLQSNSIELRQAQLSLIEAQDRYINAQYRAQIAATAIRYITGEISKQ